MHMWGVAEEKVHWIKMKDIFNENLRLQKKYYDIQLGQCPKDIYKISYFVRFVLGKGYPHYHIIKQKKGTYLFGYLPP